MDEERIKDAAKRLIFAADVESREELRKYLGIFSGRIGAVKLGMTILTMGAITGAKRGQIVDATNESVFHTVLAESDLQIEV